MNVPKLTPTELANIRALSAMRMSETVDVEAWWGERGATNVNYTGSSDPTAATTPIPAAFQDAEDFANVPSRVVATSGSTYTDGDGKSYSVSGITVYTPVAFTRETIFTFGQAYNNLFYYGHFVVYDGRAWRIETVNVMDSNPQLGVLNCVEASRELDIDVTAGLDYLLDDSWGFLLTDTDEAIVA